MLGTARRTQSWILVHTFPRLCYNAPELLGVQLRWAAPGTQLTAGEVATLQGHAKMWLLVSPDGPGSLRIIAGESGTYMGGWNPQPGIGSAPES